MPDPLVSVVMPAYNAEKTVRYAIQSLLEQTMSDLEILVVDDASTDGTVQAVESIHDSRVRLLKSTKNLRQAAARNLGLRYTRGRWVAFLDADDEWVPERIARLLAVAQGEPECYVADLYAASVPDTEGRLKPVVPLEFTAHPLTQDFDFTDYVERALCVYPMVPSAAMNRHHIEFPEWGSCGDWAFLVARLSASGIKGKLSHQVGYLYRVTGTHDSSTLRGIEEELEVAEFLAKEPEIAETAKARLRQQSPLIRKRLIVAALRERKWGKLAHYARRNPADLLGLPGSALRYLQRRVHYSSLGGSAHVVV